MSQSETISAPRKPGYSSGNGLLREVDLRYTTNSIESLHSQARKAVRGRRHFPSDKAATKLIWLALQNVEAKLTRSLIAWHQAKSQLAIHFEDRFVLTD